MIVAVTQKYIGNDSTNGLDYIRAAITTESAYHINQCFSVRHCIFTITDCPNNLSCIFNMNPVSFTIAIKTIYDKHIIAMC